MPITLDRTKPIPEWNWSAHWASQLKAFGNFTAADWKRAKFQGARDEAKSLMLGNQRHHCHYCRHPIHDELGHVEIDHVIPKDFAPQLTYETFNLVATCKRCNNAKQEANTTTVSEADLGALTPAQMRICEYIWIHPYLDSYAHHIALRGDYIYQGLDEKGWAVIRECKLANVKEVLARKRMGIFDAAPNDEAALLRLMILWPHLDGEDLFTQLVLAGGPKALTEDECRAMIARHMKLRGE